jgi:competence ComEA-like helix-hairpin-helix protein
MKFLKEYFVFSTSERRGIFLFSSLLFVMLLVYFIIPTFIKPAVYQNKEFREEIAQLMAKKEALSGYGDDKVDVILFKFNPNTLTKQGFISLGLSTKQSQTILNYRNKGGRFYKKEDFKKIYAITDKDYSRLSPYIVFKAKENKYPKDEFIGVNKQLDSLFKFDPNIVNEYELTKLGFSKKQAIVFLNYRNKGGKFYKPEDVKKIYAVTEKLYRKIESYIDIENVTKQVVAAEEFSIEINSATPEEFKKIKGIGEKISLRIVKYRERLGGFYSVNHLAEVYGVEQELIDNNKKHFIIDKSKIKKININRVTIKEFYSHPYISFNDARKIVNFKEVHGLFTTVNEIRTNDLVKEEVYSKIVHYLICR